MRTQSDAYYCAFSHNFGSLPVFFKRIFSHTVKIKLNSLKDTARHTTGDNWDITFTADSSPLRLNIRELWKYKYLLGMIVLRDFKLFYKQTILGPIWFLIQPLFTAFIFSFVFGYLAGIGTDGTPRPLFYLSGVICWAFFSDCISRTSFVLRDNANLFSKVYFPRMIMPVSNVCSSFIKFIIQASMLGLMLIYYNFTGEFDFEPTPFLLLLPVFIIHIAALGFGLGLVISAMTMKYRDLSHLVNFGIQLAMYITPVIYPLSSAPEKYRGIIASNPVTPIMEGIRFALFNKGSFSVSDWAASLICTCIVLVSGILIFNRVERTFVDYV
jgi:lipopolysaccharide transport system permease protein